jgi:DNA-binding CsgD family transcriptional regulator/tetratricopeptide (TPR) repeat protein
LELAARLARAAIAAGSVTDATLRLADVLTNAGQLDEADALLAELATTEIDDRARVTIASIRATSLLWLRARPAEARAVLDAADAALQDRALAQELNALRLHALLLEGRVVDIGAVVDDILGADVSYEMKAGALIAGVPAWLTTADFHSAIAHCETGRSIAARSNDAFPVDELLDYGIAVAHLYLGDLDGAEKDLRELRRASALEGGILRFLFSQGIGRVEMLRGRFDNAASGFQEAVALIQYSPELIAWNLGLLATAQVLAGDLEAGEHNLVEASGLTPSQMFVVDRDRAGALLANGRGERSRAASASLEAGDRALELGQRLPAVFCFHDAARFGAAREAVARFAALGDFPGSLFAAMHAHVRALDAGAADGLCEASDQLEQVGCHRWAADAAAAAARAYAGEGLRSRATQMAEHARRLGSIVDAEIAELDDLRTVATLTARERDIAGMAARGMSDREIGGALGISVRTVETHLHRVYGKLGIESRAELAAYVVDY